MMTMRRSDDRGHFDHGWLDTRHSFSFAAYHDLAHMGFRALRVLNEDVVAPGRGFGTHGHQDMEILTWVLDGELQHRDSSSDGGSIRPGEMQRMTAGRGIQHSERNGSSTNPVHFLQIWIHPETEGLPPGYEQKDFGTDWTGARLVASRDGEAGSLLIHQDARVWVVRPEGGNPVSFATDPSRGVWVQVARGHVTVDGEALAPGDGAAIEGVEGVEIRGADGAEALVFDVA